MRNWIAKIWKSLSTSGTGKHGRDAYRIEYAAELPTKLRRQRLYAIGEHSRPWSAALLCPCDCGAVIQLSLLDTDSPSWHLALDRRGRPTLSPSVRRTKGCRAHFWLCKGRITWCFDRIE